MGVILSRLRAQEHAVESILSAFALRPVTQKVDRTRTGPGVQLWLPKVDRARAKAKVRAKARARVRARATARAQTMHIRQALQAFVRTDHFSQAKIGPGVHFLPGPNIARQATILLYAFSLLQMQYMWSPAAQRMASLHTDT